MSGSLNSSRLSNTADAHDFEEEEKKLMQGSRNVENKDDFWISLSQQL